MWMKHYLRLYPMTRFIHHADQFRYRRCLGVMRYVQHPTRVVISFISFISIYNFEIFLNSE